METWDKISGLKTTGDDGKHLMDRVNDIFERRKCKMSLVGWSLGGVMCREVAKAVPEKIRQVITLGSPIAGRPDASNVHWLYERLTGHVMSEEEFAEIQAHMTEPPHEVPSTSIYTKTDGIVAWRTCIEPPATNTDNIEVYASHCGLGVNASVYYALADRLCLPDEEWSPFDRNASLWRRMTYPKRRAWREKTGATSWREKNATAVILLT